METQTNTIHEQYMKRAIELAEKGRGYTSPNPIVGCVVVKDGRIISEGYHERYGEFHAERNALLRCKEDPEDADLYVTLEPCCHQGKTPPCTDIIIEKNVDAVIVAQLYEAKLIDQAYPLHNDVLKVFIEFGAPGLLIWSGAQYIAFPLLIKKFFDADTAVLYISVLTLMSTTYLTDNTAFYFWCMMALRMIPLAYGIYRKSKFSEIKEEKAKWSPPSRSDFSQLVNERLARDGGKK